MIAPADARTESVGDQSGFQIFATNISERMPGRAADRFAAGDDGDHLPFVLAAGGLHDGIEPPFAGARVAGPDAAIGHAVRELLLAMACLRVVWTTRPKSRTSANGSDEQDGGSRAVWRACSRDRI